ncbi:MAG: FmdE family protein [Anaerolineae bacterium]|nr:FmdE family protein [Anaerolineae bacterium]
MQVLDEVLKLSAARHAHLCPRQVLGARMGLAGAAALGLEVPRQDKRLLVIAETDGCFLDGLEVACRVAAGRRTLRIEDYGKVAASFVDVQTGAAIRLAPQPDVRVRALDYAPDERRHYFAQLIGYQIMPEEVLFSLTSVVLNTPVTDLISRAGVRTNCTACGEEIINEREMLVEGLAYCRSCAGQSYYQMSASAMPIFSNIEPVSSSASL